MTQDDDGDRTAGTAGDSTGADGAGHGSDRTGDVEEFGTITWWEIPATDLAASVRFYRDAFGWDVTPMHADYENVLHAGTMVGGIYTHDAAQGPLGDGTRLTINVRDLEASLDAVAAAGGVVLAPRAAIGEGFGWWALFRDPGGLAVGLASPHPAAG